MGAAIVILLFLTSFAHAGAAPSLAATPHQRRTLAADSGWIKLWDTAWWITLRATPAGVPLARIEYHARFADDHDPRTLAGHWDVDGEDRNGFTGRVPVTCATRPDYDRRLRVKVRVVDVNDTASDWVDMVFPATESSGDDSAPPLTAEPSTERRSESLGTVQIIANDDMTIADAKAALQRRARDKGGDAAIGFRLVETTGNRVTFAADVIRYVDVPATPTPARTGTAPDRVLAELAMPGAR
ncbi:MAG: hypothetical protein HYR72_22930 [Deltaproteobacteria bacterium]|nr:hypothetical protein [Deltaproteobacteria bacterium]